MSTWHEASSLAFRSHAHPLVTHNAHGAAAPFLLYPPTGRLELDAFCAELMLAAEFQGCQHTEFPNDPNINSSRSSKETRGKQNVALGWSRCQTV